MQIFVLLASFDGHKYAVHSICLFCRNAVFRLIALISHLFEASNANIDLTPIQGQHGESVGESFGSSNPHAQILAFVMLCLSLTFRLITHLTEIQD